MRTLASVVEAVVSSRQAGLSSSSVASVRNFLADGGPLSTMHWISLESFGAAFTSLNFHKRKTFYTITAIVYHHLLGVFMSLKIVKAITDRSPDATATEFHV